MLVVLISQMFVCVGASFVIDVHVEGGTQEHEYIT